MFRPLVYIALSILGLAYNPEPIVLRLDVSASHPNLRRRLGRNPPVPKPAPGHPNSASHPPARPQESRNPFHRSHPPARPQERRNPFHRSHPPARPQESRNPLTSRKKKGIDERLSEERDRLRQRERDLTSLYEVEVFVDAAKPDTYELFEVERAHNQNPERLVRVAAKPHWSKKKIAARKAWPEARRKVLKEELQDHRHKLNKEIEDISMVIKTLEEGGSVKARDKNDAESADVDAGNDAHRIREYFRIANIVMEKEARPHHRDIIFHGPKFKDTWIELREPGSQSKGSNTDVPVGKVRGPRFMP